MRTRSVETPTHDRARAGPGTDRLRLQSIAASITGRDQRICIDPFEHRVLTTIQLYELHFPSYPRARKRPLELHRGAPLGPLLESRLDRVERRLDGMEHSIADVREWLAFRAGRERQPLWTPRSLS